MNLKIVDVHTKSIFIAGIFDNLFWLIEFPPFTKNIEECIDYFVNEKVAHDYSYSRILKNPKHTAGISWTIEVKDNELDGNHSNNNNSNIVVQSGVNEDAFTTPSNLSSSLSVDLEDCSTSLFENDVSRCIKDAWEGCQDLWNV